MPGSAEVWQRLLIVARNKTAEFWTQAATINSAIRGIRTGFDISRSMTQVRGNMMSNTEINTIMGSVSASSPLRRIVADITAAVIGAAPQSGVTTSIVALGVQAGNDLAAAQQLIELARQRENTIIQLLSQVENAASEGANFALAAERKVADANAVLVRIEVRIRRPIDQIGGV